MAANEDEDTRVERIGAASAHDNPAESNATFRQDSWLLTWSLLEDLFFARTVCS